MDLSHLTTLVLIAVACLLLQPTNGINVVVVRHGERPADASQDSGHLTEDGKSRAKYLADTWGSGSGPLTNVRSTALIYCYGSKAYREKELLQPLLTKTGGSFDKCNLINDKFGCGDGLIGGMNKCATNLVDSYEKKGITDVVIAWEHSCIRSLVKDLNNGVDGVASGVNWGQCDPNNCSPSCSQWPGDSDGVENKKGCFDVYFQFPYKGGRTPHKGAQGFVGSPQLSYNGTSNSPSKFTGSNSTESHWAD